MVTSLGSTANSDVTYMMMDFLSGNCTATSERGGGENSGREVEIEIKHERQHGRWSERRRLEGEEGERGEKRAG